MRVSSSSVHLLIIGIESMDMLRSICSFSYNVKPLCFFFLFFFSLSSFSLLTNAHARSTTFNSDQFTFYCIHSNIAKSWILYYILCIIKRRYQSIKLNSSSSQPTKCKVRTQQYPTTTSEICIIIILPQKIGCELSIICI